MAVCEGVIDHCCNLGRHGVCKFLVRTDDRWRCSLRSELGSWQAVHVDARYVEHVKPKLADLPPVFAGMDCGDYPRPGELCRACGTVG